MTWLWRDPTTLCAALVAVAAGLLFAAVARGRLRETSTVTGGIEGRRFLLLGALRGALGVLALALAGCLILILLPETTIRKMVRAVRPAQTTDAPGPPIALLYLGDETKGKDFHIRGFVRNIAPKPIEKLDASIRLYAPDGSVHQTALARTDVDSIAPDATAEFHLVYPEFAAQFTSYSVDFKLRSGEFLPYKDWRATRRLN